MKIQETDLEPFQYISIHKATSNIQAQTVNPTKKKNTTHRNLSNTAIALVIPVANNYKP